MAESVTDAEVRYREETLPAHDPSHGTPHPMVRRRLDFQLPKGEAHWEQTDYGHPGRLNPWEPRGIDVALQAWTAQLRTAAEVFGAPLSGATG